MILLHFFALSVIMAGPAQETLGAEFTVLGAVLTHGHVTFRFATFVL